jgi:hypothetical protein
MSIERYGAIPPIAPINHAMYEADRPSRLHRREIIADAVIQISLRSPHVLRPRVNIAARGLVLVESVAHGSDESGLEIVMRTPQGLSSTHMTLNEANVVMRPLEGFDGEFEIAYFNASAEAEDPFLWLRDARLEIPLAA